MTDPQRDCTTPSPVRGVRHRHLRRGGVVLLVMGIPTGCLGGLDTLGVEEIVTESQGLNGKPAIEDDRIEDKHPAFDPARVVIERFDPPGGWGIPCDVSLNKSATVTKLEILPFGADAEGALKDKLFATRPGALQVASAIAGVDTIPSMEVVNGFLKPFDDGLYAAVELVLEDGANGAALGKKRVLTSFLAGIVNTLGTAAPARRPPLEDAAVLIGASLILGGESPILDSALLGRARQRAQGFSSDPRARPIGFYSWNPALGQIFTQDRFLQNVNDDESFATFIALALVLQGDPALAAEYQRWVAMYAGLTNPYVAYTLDVLVPFVAGPESLDTPDAVEASFRVSHPAMTACLGPRLAFLPGSHSKESDFFDGLYCGGGAPAAVNLIDVLINGLRGHDLDLAPTADSGWYDYQLFALETLLLPERGAENQNMLLTAGYKRKLIDSFKSILIQHRETHVKQLAYAGNSAAEIPPVDVYPLFPVEPFPTFYLRTARAYRFLRTFLEANLGTGVLDGTRRLRETGDSTTAVLSVELAAHIQLLYGLYFLSADAVGMDRNGALLPDELVEVPPDAAVTRARAWLKDWRTDPDVASDPRVIVPIWQDDATTRYWAVIGVKAVRARASFVSGHEPEITWPDCASQKIVAHDYTMLVEETAEVEIGNAHPPLTRAELRDVCDRYTTKDDIVRALEAL